LKTIREENGDDESEHGETVTEDNTSEAIYESDDDGKPRNKREDDDDDDDDNVDDMREVELLQSRHSDVVKLNFFPFRYHRLKMNPAFLLSRKKHKRT
jgi:hypothetical protein